MADPSKDFRNCFLIRCMKYPKCGRTLGLGCTIEGIGEMDFDDPKLFIQPEECGKEKGFPYFRERLN